MPSASVAPVSVISFSLWFGGHRFGPPVTLPQTGLWLSVVTTVELSFAPLGLDWSPLIAAEFVRDVPELPAVTVMSNVVDAPLARLAAVHVTTPAAWVHPALADTNVEFAGSVSVTVTPLPQQARCSRP